MAAPGTTRTSAIRSTCLPTGMVRSTWCWSFATANAGAAR